MKCRNSLPDFYAYLVLVYGKVFLLVRMGNLRQAFENLSNLADAFKDKSRLCIEYTIDQAYQDMLQEGNKGSILE